MKLRRLVLILATSIPAFAEDFTNSGKQFFLEKKRPRAHAR
jgi:hypothetical protein